MGVMFMYAHVYDAVT